MDPWTCSSSIGQSRSSNTERTIAPMLLLFAAIGALVTAHVAPFPFLFDTTDDTPIDATLSKPLIA